MTLWYLALTFEALCILVLFALYKKAKEEPRA